MRADLRLAYDALARLERLIDKADPSGPTDVRSDLATLRQLVDFYLDDPGAGGSDEALAQEEIVRQPRLSEACASNPVFIIGHRRSGTTILAWLLNSHPAIAAIPENLVCGSWLASGFGRPSAVTLPLRSVEYLGESRANYLGRVASLIDGVFSDYARRQAKSRWVAKETNVSDHLDLLDAVFDYRARFIYLFRHGLDVAFSASVVDRGEMWVQNDQQLSLERHLRSWVQNNQATADFVSCNQQRCHLVRYEDLVTSPEPVAQKLFEWLGETWSPALLEAMQRQRHPMRLGGVGVRATGGRIHGASHGRWSSWPEPLLARLGRIANSTLVRLEYSPIRQGAAAPRLP